MRRFEKWPFISETAAAVSLFYAAGACQGDTACAYQTCRIAASGAVLVPDEGTEKQNA